MEQSNNQDPQLHESRPRPVPVDYHAVESLFESYEPRSASTIVAQQQALQESHAAEAAAIILEGVELPEFTYPDASAHDELLAQTYSDTFGHIRTQRISLAGRLITPGAQCIYSLITITLLGGMMGLAASVNSPALVLTAGILSPILLPICIWKWIRWLDSTPYYYRLLTSLGEDARNLLNYRLFWKRASQNT